MNNKPYHEKLENAVILLTSLVQENCGKRRLGSADLPKLHKSIAKIISDSVAITKGRQRKRWASIHKASGHYSVSRYHDANITYRIHVTRAYETLIKLGYLAEVKKGVNADGAKFLTRYEATDKLTDLFSEDDRITLKHLSNERVNTELIRVQLRDAQGHKYLANYEETSTTIKMRDQMAFINDVLSKSAFDLEITRDELEQLEDRMHERAQERDGGDGRLRLQDVALYRVFNDVDFTLGGRLYGGWWQTIPSEYRRRIRINGKRTVELDFGTLHPTILCQEAGIRPPDDSYDIALRPQSFDAVRNPDAFRGLVKACFNAMLNSTYRTTRPPRDINLKPWGLKWGQMVDAILEKHQPIADRFFTGQGLRLQMLDSTIAANLMENFAKQMGTVPLLPVHDSFISHHGYENDVKAAMEAEFKKVCKADIRVKRTGWDDDLSHPSRDPDKRSVFDADTDLLDAFS
jgi:hypothetical protein